MSKLISFLFAFMATLSVAYCDKARIVGGSFAADKQFPYQVALLRNNPNICSGSILNAGWIVTAAHCVVDKDTNILLPGPGFLFVSAGTNVLGRPGGQFVGVKKIIVHENYVNNVNDIALIKLAQPLQFNDAVKPISLMHGEVPSGEKVVISGWGRTGEDKKISQALKFNIVTAIRRSECKRRAGIDRPKVICLDHSAGEGTCIGDSGGPAVWNGKLVGITSFRVAKCGSDAPDVYTKVSSYLSWISKNVQ